MSTTQSYNTIDQAKAGDEGARESHESRQGANDREYNRPFDLTGTAIKYGLMAGVLLGMVQLYVLAIYGRVNIGHGLYGFVVMVPFIWLAIRAYRAKLAAGEVFKNGAILGLYTSIVASLLMAAITLVGGLIGVASADGSEAIFGNVAVYSFFQILIGIVFGMIITFILLQGLKSDVPADTNIEKVEGHA